VSEALASSLAGKRIVITRAVQQSSELCAALRNRGAIPISLPLVSFAPPENYAPLDAGLRDLTRFDWIVFSSANAVRAVVERRKTLAADQYLSAKSPHVAAVGPATKQEAENAGFSVEYVAKTHLGVALVAEMAERLRGKRVFLPRSDRANPDLPAALHDLGATVTEVVAYRTLPPTDLNREQAARIASGEADAILFFSPSAVHCFVGLVGAAELAALQNKIVLATVGPVTAAALRAAGVDHIVTAADITAPAVVDALQAHFATESAKPSIAGAKHG
jgi:uroporphyrinogen-III synthase